MKENLVFGVVPQHRFTVEGVTFEWVSGMYFKKINEIEEEGSFGSDALISKSLRNATIKTEGESVHLATLT